MTNQQHPITPPYELIEEWIEQFKGDHPIYIATQAAQWGADQELEACCEWFQEFYKTESWVKHDLKHFRNARRPKPPSLKQQALMAIDTAVADNRLSADVANVVRQALEQIND
jgi:hypothetical protein